MSEHINKFLQQISEKTQTSVIDMFDYEEKSYRLQLKKLYRFLDAHCLSERTSTERRLEFNCMMRGQFIQVCRRKRQVPVSEIMAFLNISRDYLMAIELGQAMIADQDFCMLIRHLGCGQEIPRFLQKLEKSTTIRR